MSDFDGDTHLSATVGLLHMVAVDYMVDSGWITD